MALSKVHVLASSSDASSKSSYEYFRNEELKRSENDQLRVYGTNLGLHIDSVGRLAIGYGYDLQVRAAATSAKTLQPYLVSGVSITTRQIAYLEAYRTNAPLNLPSDPLDKSIPTRSQVLSAWNNITLASEGKATQLLNHVAETFENIVPQTLLPYSKERAAVISSCYNLGSIGKNLLAALNADNRAEAWYEIRYNSNGGKSRSLGIANRRYRESDL